MVGEVLNEFPSDNHLIGLAEMQVLDISNADVVALFPQDLHSACLVIHTSDGSRLVLDQAMKPPFPLGFNARFVLNAPEIQNRLALQFTLYAAQISPYMIFGAFGIVYMFIDHNSANW